MSEPQRPSRKLTVFLFLLGLACLGIGLRESWVVIHNPKPLALTCNEFARARPNADWLQLDGCELVLEGMLETRKSTGKYELWVPVRPRGAQPDTPSVLLLASSDPALVDYLEQGSESPHLTDLLSRSTLQGVLKWSEDPRVFSQAARLPVPMAEDFVILEDGGQPRTLEAAMALAISVFLLAGAGWAWRRYDIEVESNAVEPRFNIEAQRSDVLSPGPPQLPRHRGPTSSTRLP